MILVSTKPGIYVRNIAVRVSRECVSIVRELIDSVGTVHSQRAARLACTWRVAARHPVSLFACDCERGHSGPREDKSDVRENFSISLKPYLGVRSPHFASHLFKFRISVPPPGHSLDLT